MSFSFVKFNVTNSSLLLLIGKISGVANFYVLNSTGFSEWSSEVLSSNVPNGYKYAESLVGNGIFYIFRNTTTVIIPSTDNVLNSTPVYSFNSLGIAPPGTYYAVIDNTNGSASDNYRINATVFTLPQASQSANLPNFVYEEAELGIAFFILFVAGIIMTIYGVFKKEKDSSIKSIIPNTQNAKGNKDSLTDEQIDELYKNIKKKKENS